MAGWQSGYAAACKAVYAGSIPASASNSGFSLKFIRFMKSFFASALFFIKRIFISTEVDFIFSYHQSFAKKDGTLPELIEPLISYCKKYDYSYIIFEETDITIQEKYIFPDKAVPLIFISLIESFLRKFFTWTSSENFSQDWRQGINRGALDQKVSKITSFFVSKIECKKIITLVSHKSNFWFYGLPSADMYDLQHGIIFDGDINYLFNGLPPEFKVRTEMKTLVHSDFFKNLLINRDDTNFYDENNVKKIGRSIIKKDLSNTLQNESQHERYILFSAQNALDCGEAQQKKYLEKATNFFINIKPILFKYNFKIIHRDHPRANLDEPIPYLENEYIFRSNNKDLWRDIEDSFLHITFNSSSAIEAASFGLPTIFLELDNPSSGDFPDLASKDIYLRQYKYPHKNLFVSSIQDFDDALSDYIRNITNYSEGVLQWHNTLVESISDDSISKALSL